MNPIRDLIEPQLSASRHRRIFGIVCAKVASIEPDGSYRLEYLSMGAGESSAPARVMMPMAGDKRGIHFAPEPGDEVICAFEDGDVNLPVILGAVWNSGSPVPDQADASPTNNTRTIVSRSGHEITLDDTQMAEKVLIKTKSGHTLEMDDKPASEKITLKSKGGHSLTMDDSPGRAKVTIKSALGHTLELDDTPPGKITLKASAGSGITLDNTGIASIESLASMSLKSLQVAVSASGGVQLQTTGSVTTSLVMIDGKPFGMHMHIDYTSGTTGIVIP